jgi:hypothetical protein
MDGTSTTGIVDVPRNHKGKGWSIDKVRRWRSKLWREFARGLSPVMPEGAGSVVAAHWNSPTVAAHFRLPGTGMGIKPADCFVYPLHDGTHKEMHQNGQETADKQWEWVTSTMVAGLEQGVLTASVLADAWIRGLKVSAYDRTFCLSTPNIESVAAEWAWLFVGGNLRLSNT